jgi:hypothetical protein
MSEQNTAVLSCPDAQGHVRPTMQNERDDVWNTTFYHRAIRNTIGEVLSQSKRYDLSQPLPERIHKLLVQLDEESVQRLAGKRTPPR